MSLSLHCVRIGTVFPERQRIRSILVSQLIQTPLSRLCSVQHRGRAHAKHQNRLIQGWTTSDDFPQSPFDLDRLFVLSPRSTEPDSLL